MSLYEESYPPEILRGYTPPVVGAGAARRTSTSSTATFTVAAGEPGEYDPEVAPADRPSNVTALRERARPADPAPWAEGQYVLVGTSGKRAHWGGDDWHGGESPGYPEPEEESADETDAAEDDGADDETTDADE